MNAPKSKPTRRFKARGANAGRPEEPRRAEGVRAEIKQLRSEMNRLDGAVLRGAPLLILLADKLCKSRTDYVKLWQMMSREKANRQAYRLDLEEADGLSALADDVATMLRDSRDQVQERIDLLSGLLESDAAEASR